MIRLLVPGDEASLEAFLAGHPASSMFLRSNLRQVGLVDRGERYHGTYVASINHDDQIDHQMMTAVAAHAWNGMLLLQAPTDLAEVATGAVRFSGREVRGLAGPWGQVCGARAALGLESRGAALESNEDLFELELAGMRTPDFSTQVRRARESDLDTLAEWRHDYMVEALHATPGPDLRQAARGEIVRAIAEGSGFVLDRNGALLSYSGFNAQLPDVVQIGGVYTPRALRGRGLARATVAGSLMAARSRGVLRAILFTDRHNAPARRAYLALGFEPIGDYGLIML